MPVAKLPAYRLLGLTAHDTTCPAPALLRLAAPAGLFAGLILMGYGLVGHGGAQHVA